MEKLLRAYLAGIIDGEGCISITKVPPKRGRVSPAYRLSCALGMANAYIPQLFKFSFGGSVSRSQKGQNKTIWSWRTSGILANTFLKALLPYLRLKRNEAELAIKFQGRKSVHGGVKGIQGHPLKTDEEWAVEEAQYILMRNLKDKSEVTVNG